MDVKEVAPREIVVDKGRKMPFVKDCRRISSLIRQCRCLSERKGQLG